MRVAMLSPIAWSTPPKKYGPWEYIVSLLTESLLKKGIDVTLFATGDSSTAGKLHSVYPRPYEEDKEMNVKVYESLHIAEVFERADEFDIIHNHFDFLPLTYSRLVDTPVVTTIHGFSSRSILPVYKKYNENTFYVSISDSHRCPELDYVATVLHGIDVESFPFNEKPQDYILFLSRLDRFKGIKDAIEISKRSGMKLRIAGFIPDMDYFEKEVRPHIDGEQITYEGHIDSGFKKELLSNAYALIHPVKFDEPFGLGIVEAFACGTPVIAYNRGSMPELIQSGETGFIVNDIDEAVDALKYIDSIPRRKCREVAEKQYSADRMADDYINAYETILDKRKTEDKRPWGYYKILSDDPGFKVKTITVMPGEKISLQRHFHRSEHWFVVEGEGVVDEDKQHFKVKDGDSVDIPTTAVHRIMNTGDENLTFVEIAKGDFIEEEDIERLEDKYGRV
ncbi:glycosyltransferase [Methanolobus halotolerans]|uniref:Mannose-6-phosphate isomerase n=1 Tax=Methanolobus halotolerans TaxID=2052935 RepID=A0A4E0PY82_9EURY|nr:glycosyltransferase [Methanolobus halotolerans]TGC09820.1 mannose-6-phosphate isomerase [Methanolobus halotolerans]